MTKRSVRTVQIDEAGHNRVESLAAHLGDDAESRRITARESGDKQTREGTRDRDRGDAGQRDQDADA